MSAVGPAGTKARGRKGLAASFEELREGHVATRLEACLRRGWSSRQGFPSGGWKPLRCLSRSHTGWTTRAALGEQTGGAGGNQTLCGGHLGGSGDRWQVAAVMEK